MAPPSMMAELLLPRVRPELLLLPKIESPMTTLEKSATAIPVPPLWDTLHRCKVTAEVVPTVRPLWTLPNMTQPDTSAVDCMSVTPSAPLPLTLQLPSSAQVRQSCFENSGGGNRHRCLEQYRVCMHLCSKYSTTVEVIHS